MGSNDHSFNTIEYKTIQYPLFIPIFIITILCPFHIYNFLLFFKVCLNCWVWSTVFHARDTPFTEMMDYFSAFSTVLFSFYAMVIRLVCFILFVSESSKKKKTNVKGKPGNKKYIYEGGRKSFRPRLCETLKVHLKSSRGQ